VPELRSTPAGVVVCAAAAAALDALVAPGHGSRPIRTAPDELLVLAPPDVVDGVTREVRDRIDALDPDALVLDVSDGWHGWSLVGEDASRALAFLSRLDPPEVGGAVLGDVARVGAIVLDEPDGFTVLVPAFHGEHIRECAIRDAAATEVRG
jgi:hypothetical protein